MALYQDELEKLKYLSSRIAKSLALQGNYPDSDSIQKRLDSVDTKLAIFQHIEEEEGELLDVEKMNNDFLAIYMDLLILYNLVYGFTVTRYQETKTYVESHLTDLEELARRYEKRHRLETQTTAIGDTVFFKTNGFEVETRNCYSFVNLGKIQFTKGSRVAFLFSSRNVPLDSVLFLTGEINVQCSPYELNKDYMIIPGEPSKKTYTYEPIDDIFPDDIQAININDFIPVSDYDYVIFGGKDTIQKKSNNVTQFIEKEKGSSFYFTDNTGRVTFYVVDGTYISFNFSSPLLSQNFTGTKIDTLNSHHKITFEYEGPFGFDYVTDGTVYATAENGIINGNTLYYPNADNLNYFLVEEYDKSDKVTYDVSISISNFISDEAPDINMVAIKEARMLEAIKE